MNKDEAELESMYNIAFFSKYMQTGVLGGLHWTTNVYSVTIFAHKVLKRCIVFCYCECIVFYCPEGDGHWMQAGALDSHSVVFWLLLSVSCVVVRFTSAFSFVVLKQTQAVHSPYALYNIKTVTSDTQSLCTLQYIKSHKRYTVPMHSTI